VPPNTPFAPLSQAGNGTATSMNTSTKVIE
jgi:hypothetical protein